MKIKHLGLTVRHFGWYLNTFWSKSRTVKILISNISKVARALEKKPRSWVSIEYERENFSRNYFRAIRESDCMKTRISCFLQIWLTAVFTACVGSLWNPSLRIPWHFTDRKPALNCQSNRNALLRGFCDIKFWQILAYSRFCPMRGVPHTPTFRIPLKHLYQVFNFLANFQQYLCYAWGPSNSNVRHSVETLTETMSLRFLW